jgi:hypothetical protein
VIALNEKSTAPQGGVLAEDLFDTRLGCVKASGTQRSTGFVVERLIGP